MWGGCLNLFEIPLSNVEDKMSTANKFIYVAKEDIRQASLLYIIDYRTIFSSKMKKTSILKCCVSIVVGPKVFIQSVIIHDNKWAFFKEKLVYCTSYLHDYHIMLIQIHTCKYSTDMHISRDDRNRSRILLTRGLRRAHVNNTANPKYFPPLLEKESNKYSPKARTYTFNIHLTRIHSSSLQT